MGDTGSLALGGALGAIAILLKSEFLLLIVGGVFVAETAVGDPAADGVQVSEAAPRLEYAQKAIASFCGRRCTTTSSSRGGTRPRSSSRFWILGILCAFLALTTLKLR